MNTVYAPNTITRAESFVWYQAAPRLQLGLAFLWRQEAFRVLASWQAIPEKAGTPSLNFSAGVQGIGTGNPGFSSTIEKNWRFEGTSYFNAYVGVGFRTNENHGHPLGGLKYSPDGKVTVGFQHDGHNGHPFATYSMNNVVLGAYLVAGRYPGAMVGFRY